MRFAICISILMFGCKPKCDNIYNTSSQLELLEKVCLNPKSGLQEKSVYMDGKLISYYTYDKLGKVDSCYFWYHFINEEDTLSVVGSDSIRVFLDYTTCDINKNRYLARFIKQNGDTYLIESLLENNNDRESVYIHLDSEYIFRGEIYSIVMEPKIDTTCCKRFGYRSDTIWVKFADTSGHLPG